MTAQTYTDALTDHVAKLIADKLGNGMREKYEDVARQIVELLSERQAAMQGPGGEVSGDSIAQQLKHAKTDAWAWQMTAKGFNPNKSPKWFVVTGMNLPENPILVFTDRGFAEQYCENNPSERGYEIYAAIDAGQPHKGIAQEKQS